MGLLGKVKSDVIGSQASAAAESGSPVFVARINVDIGDAGFSGEVKHAAGIVSAVEAAGWHLDQMSYTLDKKGRPEGYFLFRRTAGGRD